MAGVPLTVAQQKGLQTERDTIQKVQNQLDITSLGGTIGGYGLQGIGALQNRSNVTKGLESTVKQADKVKQAFQEIGESAGRSFSVISSNIASQRREFGTLKSTIEGIKDSSSELRKEISNLVSDLGRLGKESLGNINQGFQTEKPKAKAPTPTESIFFKADNPSVNTPTGETKNVSPDERTTPQQKVVPNQNTINIQQQTPRQRVTQPPSSPSSFQNQLNSPQFSLQQQVSNTRSVVPNQQSFDFLQQPGQKTSRQVEAQEPTRRVTPDEVVDEQGNVVNEPSTSNVRVNEGGRINSPGTTAITNTQPQQFSTIPGETSNVDRSPRTVSEGKIGTQFSLDENLQQSTSKIEDLGSKFNTNAVSDFNNQLKQTDSLVSRVGKGLVKVADVSDQLQKGVLFAGSAKIGTDLASDLSKSFSNVKATSDVAKLSGVDTSQTQRIASKFGGNQASGLATLGAGFLGSGSVVDVAKEAAAEYNKFSQQVAKVGTVFQGSNKELEGFVSNIQSLVSGELKNAVTSTQALAGAYEVLSSGFKGAAESSKVLQAGLKLSVASGAEAGSVLRTLGKTLNAYGEDAESAAKVAGILNRTVENGITTIPELSRGFGEAATSARQANIEISELGASISELTSKGVSTAAAQTQIQRLSASIKSGRVNQRLRKEGVTNEEGEPVRLTPETIDEKGFPKALQDVRKAVDDSNIGRIFTGSRSRRAFENLTADGGKSFNKTISNIEDTSNVASNKIADAAQKNLQKVFDVKLENDKIVQFRQQVNKTLEGLLKFGKAVQPAFEAGIEKLGSLADAINKVSEKFPGLIKQSTQVALGFKAVGSAVKSVGGAALEFAGLLTTTRLVTGEIFKQVGALADLKKGWRQFNAIAADSVRINGKNANSLQRAGLVASQVLGVNTASKTQGKTEIDKTTPGAPKSPGLDDQRTGNRARLLQESFQNRRQPSVNVAADPLTVFEAEGRGNAFQKFNRFARRDIGSFGGNERGNRGLVGAITNVASGSASALNSGFKSALGSAKSIAKALAPVAVTATSILTTFKALEGVAATVFSDTQQDAEKLQDRIDSTKEKLEKIGGNQNTIERLNRITPGTSIEGAEPTVDTSKFSDPGKRRARASDSQEITAFGSQAQIEDAVSGKRAFQNLPSDVASNKNLLTKSAEFGGRFLRGGIVDAATGGKVEGGLIGAIGRKLTGASEDAGFREIASRGASTFFNVGSEVDAARRVANGKFSENQKVAKALVEGTNQDVTDVKQDIKEFENEANNLSISERVERGRDINEDVAKKLEGAKQNRQDLKAEISKKQERLNQGVGPQERETLEIAIKDRKSKLEEINKDIKELEEISKEGDREDAIRTTLEQNINDRESGENRLATRREGEFQRRREEVDQQLNKLVNPLQTETPKNIQQKFNKSVQKQVGTIETQLKKGEITEEEANRRLENLTTSDKLREGQKFSDFLDDKSLKTVNEAKVNFAEIEANKAKDRAQNRLQVAQSERDKRFISEEGFRERKISIQQESVDAQLESVRKRRQLLTEDLNVNKDSKRVQQLAQREKELEVRKEGLQLSEQNVALERQQKILDLQRKSSISPSIASAEEIKRLESEQTQNRIEAQRQVVQRIQEQSPSQERIAEEERVLQNLQEKGTAPQSAIEEQKKLVQRLTERRSEAQDRVETIQSNIQRDQIKLEQQQAERENIGLEKQQRFLKSIRQSSITSPSANAEEIKRLEVEKTRNRIEGQKQVVQQLREQGAPQETISSIQQQIQRDQVKLEQQETERENLRLNREQRLLEQKQKSPITSSNANARQIRRLGIQQTQNRIEGQQQIVQQLQQQGAPQETISSVQQQIERQQIRLQQQQFANRRQTLNENLERGLTRTRNVAEARLAPLQAQEKRIGLGQDLANQSSDVIGSALSGISQIQSLIQQSDAPKGQKEAAKEEAEEAEDKLTEKRFEIQKKILSLEQKRLQVVQKQAEVQAKVKTQEAKADVVKEAQELKAAKASGDPAEIKAAQAEFQAAVASFKGAKQEQKLVQQKGDIVEALGSAKETKLNIEKFTKNITDQLEDALNTNTTIDDAKQISKAMDSFNKITEKATSAVSNLNKELSNLSINANGQEDASTKVPKTVDESVKRTEQQLDQQNKDKKSSDKTLSQEDNNVKTESKKVERTETKSEEVTRIDKQKENDLLNNQEKRVAEQLPNVSTKEVRRLDRMEGSALDLEKTQPENVNSLYSQNASSQIPNVSEKDTKLLKQKQVEETEKVKKQAERENIASQVPGVAQENRNIPEPKNPNAAWRERWKHKDPKEDDFTNQQERYIAQQVPNVSRKEVRRTDVMEGSALDLEKTKNPRSIFGSGQTQQVVSNVPGVSEQDVKLWSKLNEEQQSNSKQQSDVKELQNVIKSFDTSPVIKEIEKLKSKIKNFDQEQAKEAGKKVDDLNKKEKRKSPDEEETSKSKQSGKEDKEANNNDQSGGTVSKKVQVDNINVTAEITTPPSEEEFAQETRDKIKEELQAQLAGIAQDLETEFDI